MHDLLAYGSPRQKKARTHENCARRLKTVRGARALLEGGARAHTE